MTRWMIALGLSIGLSLGQTVLVKASPHHAHWHYMVGARANAARSFARQLYHESVAPGALHLHLAHVNAVDVHRLLVEVGDWVEAIEAVSSSDERRAAAIHLETMARLSVELTERAATLVDSIQTQLASGTLQVDAGADDLRQAIATDAAHLFHGLGQILQAHKDAERALGIPVPDVPPDSP